MDWHKFLKLKTTNYKIYKKRKLNIIKWQKQNKSYPINESLMKAIELSTNSVVAYYDKKIKYIRDLKSKNL